MKIEDLKVGMKVEVVSKACSYKRGRVFTVAEITKEGYFYSKELGKGIGNKHTPRYYEPIKAQCENIMPKIVEELLCLKVDEEFQLEGYREGFFKFNSNYEFLSSFQGRCWSTVPNDTLVKLLKGEATILKVNKNFTPKLEEDYWTYGVEGGIIQLTWEDNLYDRLRLKNKMVYQTQREAIAMKSEAVRSLENETK